MIIKKLILKFLLQKKEKEPIKHKEINKILFIRNSKIGDAVCSFPILRELKINFPNSEIDIYAGRDNNFLFKKLPYCNNIFTKFRKRDSLKTWKQIRMMRDRKYDLVVEAVPMKFGTEFAVWYMNPRWTIGLGKFKDDNIN
ncbi:hypothetical protein CRU92_02725 [Arcobacter sp. FW59]|nr:hypothetical protein CRU92_02725 [Arcobacter sp. FW59]